MLCWRQMQDHEVHPRADAPDRRRQSRGSGAEPERPELVSRILGTYFEMPGLVLRLQQAARLFSLQFRTCEVVFDALVRAGKLRRTFDGQYALPES
jgi:hypothetical protein